MGDGYGCFKNRAKDNDTVYGIASAENLGTHDGISFDASRSSSVYKTSANLKPKSLQVLPLLKL